MHEFPHDPNFPHSFRPCFACNIKKTRPWQDGIFINREHVFPCIGPHKPISRSALILRPLEPRPDSRADAMLPAGVKEIMASPSSLFSAYASFTASMMLARTMVNDVIPRPVQSFLWSALCRLFQSKRPTQQHLTLVIEEQGANMMRNEIFDAAELYLSSRIGANTDRLKISKCPGKNKVLVRLAKNETIPDTFEGVELQWKFITVTTTHKSGPSTSFGDGDGPEEKKQYFELSFDKTYKDKIIKSYVPFVIEKSSDLKDKEKVLKMFTLGGRGRGKYGPGAWGAVDLDHPSTFDTLAMEPELKEAIMGDLDRLVDIVHRSANLVKPSSGVTKPHILVNHSRTVSGFC